jgi:hypothetical protein
VETFCDNNQAIIALNESCNSNEDILQKLLSFSTQSIIGKLYLFFYIFDQLIVKDVLQLSKMKKESKKLALMKSLNG